MFEGEVRGQLIEQMMQMSASVMALRGQINEIARNVPDSTGWAAFPRGLYGMFRAIYDVPLPPTSDICIAVVLEGGDAAPDVLRRQMEAVGAQSYNNWRLILTSEMAERSR